MKKLDSNKLTQAQQDFFKDHLSYLATVDANGEPQVGPKASMVVLDESHLQYLEKTQVHAYENLLNGSKAAVVVADVPTHTNVRVVGTAHVHDGDDYGKKVAEEAGFPNAKVVVIDVEEIFE